MGCISGWGNTMADRFTSYSPWFSNDRVYTNDEYTLLVDRSVASEAYRRLHHRDIQSIQIVIEPIRKTRSVLCSIGFAIFLIFGLLAWFDGSVVGGILLLMVGGTCGIVVLYELTTAGKRCRVFATTAVQKARLPGLNRVTDAERYLNIVMPLISDAQGTLSLEDLQAGLDRDRKKRQRKRGGMRRNQSTMRNDPPPIPETEIAPADDGEPELSITEEPVVETVPDDVESAQKPDITPALEPADPEEPPVAVSGRDE